MTEFLSVKDLQYKLKRPCDDCPFMKTSPFHEGVAESLPSYLDSIESSNFGHTCHKTDNRPEVDGPRNCKGEPEHCLGSILMLLRTSNRIRMLAGIWTQKPLMSALGSNKITDERFGELVHEANTNKSVFTLPELIRFCQRGLKKLVKHSAKKGLGQ